MFRNPIKFLPGFGGIADEQVYFCRSVIIFVDAHQDITCCEMARLPGLEDRSPDRWVLTRGAAPEGWQALPSPDQIGSAMAGVQSLYVEGGAGAAAAFLRAGLVDRLHLYRAPLLIGSGRPALADLGLASLAEAHGQWRLSDRRQLGSDTFESYDAVEN